MGSTGGLTAHKEMKQSARQFMAVASDKLKIVSANTIGKGDHHDLDIAIIKSTTSQFHVVPKEKHVRTLKGAVHPAQPRTQVGYVIGELVQRLHKATDWVTALKTLMVIHRLMRESDISFLEELLKYSESVTQGKGHVLNMDNFIDTTNIEGRFDMSEWVRAYGKYLDEQLEVYARINFYQEQEHSGEPSRMRSLNSTDLLFQLPFLQKLLERLMDCKPGVMSGRDPIVQGAVLVVLKESFKMYKAISEGLINLADRFFDMEFLEAQKGLDIYKESMVASDRLQAYYRAMEQIDDLRRAIQFPKLESPPADFVKQMENYVKDCPRPLDDQTAGSKKRSPPLRRGSKLAGGKRDAAPVGSAAGDPGMVVAFNKAAAPGAPAAPAASQPDLLGFDDLSVSSSSDAAPAVASGGGASSGGGGNMMDLLADLGAAPAPQPASPGFGGSTFGSAPANAGPVPGANPFGPQNGYMGAQQAQHTQQPPASKNPFGASFAQPSGPAGQGFGSSQAPALASSQAQGGFGGMPQMQSGFGGAPQQQQPQQQQQPVTGAPAGSAGFMGGLGPANTPLGKGVGPAPVAAGFKKDAATLDPFADLAGLKPSNATRVSPALKSMSPASNGSQTPPQAAMPPTQAAAFPGYSPSAQATGPKSESPGQFPVAASSAGGDFATHFEAHGNSGSLI
ncbi:hypothetical protein WJX72_011503 [[Myrmecia] bisecta]|uniref:ENTH domain-containing protein n=1 Tax=[Myrmecia] bisecta TaxID=41462 RepID=A0AAW1PE11_9CHLO